MRVNDVHIFPDARYSENARGAKNCRVTTVGVPDGESRDVVDFHARLVAHAGEHLLRLLLLRGLAFFFFFVVSSSSSNLSSSSSESSLYECVNTHTVPSSAKLGREMRDVLTSLMCGRKIGYETDGKLLSGGGGVVWRCRDNDDGDDGMDVERMRDGKRRGDLCARDNIKTHINEFVVLRHKSTSSPYL